MLNVNPFFVNISKCSIRSNSLAAVKSNCLGLQRKFKICIHYCNNCFCTEKEYI